MGLRFTDDELEKLAAQRTTQPQQAPLSSPPIGFGGRLLASFAPNPQGRQKILDNYGIEGIDRDPAGFDVGDIADLAGPATTFIGGLLGGVGGTIMGLPIGQPLTTGTAGAGVGAAIGEGVRQGVSNALGSGEGYNPASVATETGTAMTGELAGGALSGVLGRVLRPFRGQTERVADVMNRGRQLDESLGTDLVGKTPASARTEDTGTLFSVADSEARTARSVTETLDDKGRSVSLGEQHRLKVRDPFRQEQYRAFDQIRNNAGIPNAPPRKDMGDSFIEASSATLEQREQAMGKLFDEFRQQVPNQDNLPIVLDRTRGALRSMARSLNVDKLPDANITAGSARQLEQLAEDVSGVQNFAQLDALRKEVGRILRSDGMLEQFKQTGIDREFRRFYGALSGDIRESINEGQFAREFGGQTSGEVTDAATNVASRMEAGDPKLKLGGDDLRGPEYAQRTFGQMADNLAGRIDEALGTLERANAGFADLMSIEASSAARFLKDPEKASQIIRSLTGDKTAPGTITAVKTKIGAEGTEFNPATPEGVEAWRQFQALLLSNLRQAATSEAGGGTSISGKQLLSAMDRLGNDEVLKELLPAETVDALRMLGQFSRDTNLEERVFKRAGMEQRGESPNDAGGIVVKFLQAAFDDIITPQFMRQGNKRPPFLGGGGREYLTRGPLSGRTSSILRAIGSAGGQSSTQAMFPDATRR